MKKLCIIFIAVLAANYSYAQNQLGLSTGNYSGTTGIINNPSSFQFSPLKWDVTLISGGTFVASDYAYFLNSSVLNIINAESLKEYQPENYNSNSASKYYAFAESANGFNTQLKSFVGSPAIQYKINRKWSVGAFAQARNEISVPNAAPSLSYSNIDSWETGETKTFEPTRAAGMLWTEIGLNVAHKIKTGSVYMSFGANLKYLIGHQGFYMYTPSTTSITVNDSSFTTSSVDLHYGFTQFDQDFNLKQNGAGFGVDLGATIVKRQKGLLYKWKLSASIKDLGKVKFNNQAENHWLRSDGIHEVFDEDLSDVQSISDFAATLSNEIMGSSSASREATPLKIGTPTLFSIQFDYAIKPKVFVNLSTRQRIVTHPQQISANSQISTSIRYESKWFEAGLPVLLYNNHKPRLGLWLRMGPITIGSDHLNSIFVPQNKLGGSDIYFAIRLTDFFTKKPTKSVQPEDCMF